MPIDMNALAKVGATTRLTELRQEIAALHAAFPDLQLLADLSASDQKVLAGLLRRLLLPFASS